MSGPTSPHSITIYLIMMRGRSLPHFPAIHSILMSLGAGLGLSLSGGQITDESGHAFSLDDFYGEALGAIEDAPDAHFAALHGLAPPMPFDDANAAHADRPPP